MTLTCSKCGSTKSHQDFPPNKRNRTGRSSLCRACALTLSQAWKARRDPAERRSYDNSYHQGRKDDPIYLRNRRAARTRLRYGITLEQLEDMEAAQHHQCLICDEVRTLVVDHDHNTGEVRGLLCHRCNVRLGGWDDTGWRNRALEYLGVRT